MDYKSKDDFYNEIYRDYNENHTDSFLYKYLKMRKDRNLGYNAYLSNNNKKRKDSYVYLNSCFIAYKDKKVDKNTMGSVLERSFKDLTRDDMKSILNKNKGRLTKRVLTEELNNIIKEELIKPEFPNDGVTARMIGVLSRKYIDSDIWNLFYNIGYGKNKNTRGGGKTRRSDDALDMLFEYLSDKGDSDFAGITNGGSAKSYGSKDNSTDRLKDAEYLNECKNLFELLNRSKFGIGEMIFVPVMIDPDTGMGLYIAGGEVLERDKNDKQNCYYCCIRFDYEANDNSFGEYKLNDNDGKEIRRLKITYCFDGKGGRFTDINDAIEEYNRLKKTKEDYIGYETINEPKSAIVEESDVEAFLKYFVSPEDVSEIISRRKESELKKYKTSRLMESLGSKKRKEEKEKKRREIQNTVEGNRR